MSDDAKKILGQKGEEAVRAGRMFLDAICGEGRSVGKKLAVATARERGHGALAHVIDAEFEDDDVPTQRQPPLK